jgi:hypothetical protein
MRIFNKYILFFTYAIGWRGGGVEGWRNGGVEGWRDGVVVGRSMGRAGYWYLGILGSAPLINSLRPVAPNVERSSHEGRVLQ